MKTCTQMDGVHPRARECETGSATVQGHPEHSAVGVSWRCKKGERYFSSLAIVTVSSTLPRSMIAVAHMDANNAVDSSRSNGNSGLP